MQRYSDEAIQLNDDIVHKECPYSVYSEIADASIQLSAYEDTGLTPEEIVTMKQNIDAAYQIVAGRQESTDGWIPCSERLPEPMEKEEKYDTSVKS